MSPGLICTIIFTGRDMGGINGLTTGIPNIRIMGGGMPMGEDRFDGRTLNDPDANPGFFMSGWLLDPLFSYFDKSVSP